MKWGVFSKETKPFAPVGPGEKQCGDTTQPVGGDPGRDVGETFEHTQRGVQ